MLRGRSQEAPSSSFTFPPQSRLWHLEYLSCYLVSAYKYHASGLVKGQATAATISLPSSSVYILGQPWPTHPLCSLSFAYFRLRRTSNPDSYRPLTISPCYTVRSHPSSTANRLLQSKLRRVIATKYTCGGQAITNHQSASHFRSSVRLRSREGVFGSIPLSFFFYRIPTQAHRLAV